MLAALRQARPSCTMAMTASMSSSSSLSTSDMSALGKSVRCTDSFAPGMLLTTRFWYMFSVKKGI